jgi:ACS family glucarate transporter-like MFS transporter
VIAGGVTRPTRTRYAVLLFVYFAAFITYLDRVCISVAAPDMQHDLGLSQMQFAWVFTVFYIAYGVCEMPTAWLGDRWGQRRMLIRIVGGWSLFTILTGMVRNLATLMTTRFVFGAAEAGAFPTLSRTLSRWFPLGERGRANGIMWMGARSGGAVAPPIAVAMIALVGWRYTFAMFGVVGLIWTAVCVFWFREEPADHPSVNKEELGVIRLGAAPPPQAGERVPWKALLCNRTMIALFCSYFASGFGFQFFVTWLPTYLIREHGSTLRQSGLLSGLPLAAGAVGCLLGGVIADWITRRTGSVTIGRRTVGVSGFLLGAAGYAGAMYGHSAAAAIALLALASGAHDMTLPVLWATTTDAGGRFGGTASGFVNFASSLSGTLAPMTAALLERTFGSFHAVFLAAAAMYLSGAALWLVIDPRRPAVLEPVPMETDT